MRAMVEAYKFEYRFMHTLLDENHLPRQDSTIKESGLVRMARASYSGGVAQSRTPFVCQIRQNLPLHAVMGSTVGVVRSEGRTKM